MDITTTKNKSENIIVGNFNGTVDQFLEHCSKLDVQKIQEKIESEEKDDCISFIQKEINCDLDTAQKIYHQICLDETQITIDKLINDNLVEVVKYNEEGDPVYALTDLGKQVNKTINNSNIN